MVVVGVPAVVPLSIKFIELIVGRDLQFLGKFRDNGNMSILSKSSVSLCNGKRRLAGTRAAVFAAGVDSVDHRRCFQLTKDFRYEETIDTCCSRISVTEYYLKIVNLHSV